ncbi:MAG: hypothetical protein ACKOQS_23915 [Dolichospermum sp.]
MNESRKAALFHQLIGQCPLCHHPVSGHSISLLSSVVLNTGNQERIGELERLISNRQWSDIAKIKEGCQNSDMKQYYILACPLKGMTLLAFIFTYELWSDDWLDAVIQILPEDFIKLENIINSAWLVL